MTSRRPYLRDGSGSRVLRNPCCMGNSAGIYLTYVEFQNPPCSAGNRTILSRSFRLRVSAGRLSANQDRLPADSRAALRWRGPADPRGRAPLAQGMADDSHASLRLCSARRGLHHPDAVQSQLPQVEPAPAAARIYSFARHRWQVDDLRSHAAHGLEHLDFDRTCRGLRAGALDDAVDPMAWAHGGLAFSSCWRRSRPRDSK